MKTTVGERAQLAPSDAAIARVLQAERDARAAIAGAAQQAQQLAEQARRDAAGITERTERRTRAVVAAFQADLARQLAQIEQGSADLLQSPPPSAEDLSRLQDAVRRLARELVSGTP